MAKRSIGLRWRTAAKPSKQEIRLEDDRQEPHDPNFHRPPAIPQNARHLQHADDCGVDENGWQATCKGMLQGCEMATQASSSVTIPRDQWEDFFRSFSQEHERWQVQLEIHERETEVTVLTPETSLQSIELDLEDERILESMSLLS